LLQMVWCCGFCCRFFFLCCSFYIWFDISPLTRTHTLAKSPEKTLCLLQPSSSVDVRRLSWLDSDTHSQKNVLRKDVVSVLFFLFVMPVYFFSWCKIFIVAVRRHILHQQHNCEKRPYLNS
jgi:hypothetical protein